MAIHAQDVDTAVVVLSYNGKDYHRSFFPLLIEESKTGYDVILVDNASTDDTLEYVHTHFPEVKTIHLDVNQGFTGGYKKGLEQIKGYKYYIMLSADFEITKNWFPPLHHAMQSNPKIGACQPKIKYQKDKEYFEYAGAAGGFMDRDGYFFCRGRIFDNLEKDHGQYNTDIECFWAGGGCIMMQAALYHEVGGLELSLYAHMEEIDLCWRMKNRGYSIYCFPESTVYHVGGSVISYGSSEKLFYNFRNNLLIFTKNYYGSRYWKWLIKRLALDGLAAARYLTKGELKNFQTVARAHFSFYQKFPQYWKKRKELKSEVLPQANIKGIYKKSITRAYFLSKKEKFSQLNPADFT